MHPGFRFCSGSWSTLHAFSLTIVHILQKFYQPNHMAYLNTNNRPYENTFFLTSYGITNFDEIFTTT